MPAGTGHLGPIRSRLGHLAPVRNHNSMGSHGFEESSPRRRGTTLAEPRRSAVFRWLAETVGSLYTEGFT